MPLTGEYEPSTSERTRRQVELFEKSNGTEGTTLRGMPVIVLTTVGAKSGKLRKNALMRVEHDGEYAVVASLGGSPTHPVWYYNVVANPHVELQDGATRRDYTAREVTGAEKALWWERAVAAYPDYAAYQRRTEREIPVFVLTPTPHLTTAVRCCQGRDGLRDPALPGLAVFASSTPSTCRAVAVGQLLERRGCGRVRGQRRARSQAPRRPAARCPARAGRRRRRRPRHRPAAVLHADPDEVLPAHHGDRAAVAVPGDRHRHRRPLALAEPLDHLGRHRDAGRRLAVRADLGPEHLCHRRPPSRCRGDATRRTGAWWSTDAAGRSHR